MKKSTLVIIASFVLSGAAAIYLWQNHLHDEAVARTIAAEQRENSAGALPEPAGLAPTPVVPANTKSSVATPSAIDPAVADVTDSMRSGAVDKEQLKAMRPSVDAHMKRIYEDVSSKLGLNVEETDKFLALVSDQQFALYEGFANKPMSEAEAQAALNSWKEYRDAAIAAQLGVERAAGFREYERSIGARYEVEAIRVELENAQMPMTETQRKTLIGSAIDHGAFAPYPKFQGNSGDAEVQVMAAQADQRDQRMRELARSVFTIDQFSRYEEFVKKRHNVMESNMQLENEQKRAGAK